MKKESENKCKLSSILFIAIPFVFRAAEDKAATAPPPPLPSTTASTAPTTATAEKNESKKFNKNRNKLPPRLTTEEYFEYKMLLATKWTAPNRRSLFRTYGHNGRRAHTSRIISNWESVRAADYACITKPMPCHMQISCWHYESPSSPYCLCRHDWYAFMPFEYKIRDSSAPNSLEVFQYYSRACIRFRILCDPSAKSGLCQKRFSFAGYLTGRLRERQYQSESTVCEQTGERLQVN